MDILSIARNISTEVLILSLPRDVYGTHIEPGSLELTYSGSITIIDNEEGSLYVSGSLNTSFIGDIIYNQGLIIITDTAIIDDIRAGNENTIQLAWKSNLPIYTYNAYCTTRDAEMNFTYNPTALLSGSNGSILPSLLPHWGVDLGPYITTVGLYNNAHELIAVGKLNKPIRKSQSADTTFVVRLDI